MLHSFRASILILAAMTLLTGGVYPPAVTLIAQMVFPHQANGSLLEGTGSELIGQSFTRPEYFWGRLSATDPFPFNASASTGSNFGPLNPALVKNAQGRIEELQRHDTVLSSIPVDLVTSSASGLDPHISPAAAEVQVVRVAVARGMPEDEVRELVHRHTLGRQLGVLGESRVAVLPLNLALDRASRK